MPNHATTYQLELRAIFQNVQNGHLTDGDFRRRLFGGLRARHDVIALAETAVQAGRQQREWTHDWGPRARVWWAPGRMGTAQCRGLALVLDERILMDAPERPALIDEDGKYMAVAATIIGGRPALFIVSHSPNLATQNVAAHAQIVQDVQRTVTDWQDRIIFWLGDQV